MYDKCPSALTGNHKHGHMSDIDPVVKLVVAGRFARTIFQMMPPIHIVLIESIHRSTDLPYYVWKLWIISMSM